MELEDVLTLDGDLTVAAALAALDDAPDDLTVAILDRGVVPAEYHCVYAYLVREAATIGNPATVLLREVFVGPTWPIQGVVQQDEVTEDTPAGTLVLLGSLVLGLVTPTEGDRSSGAVRKSEVLPAGLPPLPPDLLENLGAVPTTSAPPSSPPPPSPVPSTPTPPARPTPGRRFQGYPGLRAPAVVVVHEPFILTVGFQPPSYQPGPDEDPILLPPDTAETVTFLVQLHGFGFSIPVSSHQLEVPRDRPWEVSVPVTVTAVEPSGEILRTIRATYSVQGTTVGAAWLDLTVLVGGDAPASTTTPAAGPTTVTAESPATSGGTAIGPSESDLTNPVDLTVTIRSEPGRPEVQWLFGSPHPLPEFPGVIEKSLTQGDAKAYAEHLMTTMATQKDRVTLASTVVGVGRSIANAMPVEFWQALEAAWRGAFARGPAGRIPTMLIYTSEPHVPWELAYGDSGTKLAADLLDGVDGIQLGLAWSVGRWPTSEPQNHGPDLPVAPPSTRVSRAPMAVVVGDYSGEPIPQLRYAVEEGETLHETYGALKIAIADEDVHRLMDGQVVVDNQPFHPQVVHFAAHGDSNLDQQQYSGIKLKSAAMLTPDAIKGYRLGATSQPMVFLNACKVGTAASTLNSYGGAAAAFIWSGCRAFIAPLWEVDDELAHDLSLAFYERTLRDGLTVGEAVREIRLTYAAGARTTTTPLAYVFYGHPDLRLQAPTAEQEVTP